MCSQQTADLIVQRLYKCYPQLPEESDPQVYLDRMIEVFMKYPEDRVRNAANAASERFKKRPTIAHMVELLEKQKASDERHQAIIDRYTNYKPPENYKHVPKDDQTPQERAEFVEATLAKHGFSALVLARQEKAKTIAAYHDLCRQAQVDPASIPDAPERNIDDWRHIGGVADSRGGG
jgi:hypothetical protein